MPLVESKIEGFVGTICLDYFEKRNAFSAALVEDFVKALEAFVEGRIRAVVLVRLRFARIARTAGMRVVLELWARASASVPVV
jgi:hypothetical protein